MNFPEACSGAGAPANEQPLLKRKQASSFVPMLLKISALAFPSILQQGADWLRPIVFNIFVSQRVACKEAECHGLE